MGIWEFAEEIAGDVARAGWGDNAKITSAFSTEVLSDLGGAAKRSDIYSAIKNVVNNSDLDDEIAKDVLKGLDGNKAVEAFDINNVNINGKVQKLAAKEGKTEAFDKAVEAFNKAKSMDISKGVGLSGLAKGYFGDPEFGSTRTKATLGAAVAGGIGIRYLQGGTLTEKPNGERDIAGIPFI